MAANQMWVLIGLGVFHGLHPGMGWLLAVSRGLQERSRAAVVGALPALALGHAASVALVAVAVTVAGTALASDWFAVGGAAVLVAAGVWFLLRPLSHRGHGHDARLSPWQLAAASFLMACAHGSGLMLLPVLAGRLDHGAHVGGGHAHPHGGAAAPATGTTGGTGTAGADTAGSGHVDLFDATLLGLAAAGVHTLAMLAAAGITALVVHDFFAVHALRLRWATMDRIWACTLLAGGGFVLWTVL
ncbi:cell wall anchor protein [Thermobifida halotolerans]|uniref:Cell wall anchor protein n=1 Tax=Thermobifida halotolerans TaxID=483545 RepID=A0AA97LYD7_9ACTN|nr:cell wall anchor protein [Thermobifida halotolerans]UOE20497.1 cell wall anchor protein [Thermobifida halotolerans]